MLERIVREYYQNYHTSLITVLDGSNISAANMIVLKSCYLDEYCEFVFGVLEKHLEWVMQDGYCINPKNEKSYSRVLGYIAEILTCTYVVHNKNRLAIAYTGKYLVVSSD